MDNVIADIEKPNGEIIRVQLNEFNGKYYLDMRVHYQSDEDEYKPTKKGISVPVELYEDLTEAIAKAKDAIAEIPEAEDEDGPEDADEDE